jgi:hypothetical protein
MFIYSLQVNHHKNGPFDALMQNGQKYGVYPYSVFSSADPESEDTTKCHSLSSLLTPHKLHAQLSLFWFQLFRSADNIDEDDTEMGEMIGREFKKRKLTL